MKITKVSKQRRLVCTGQAELQSVIEYTSSGIHCKIRITHNETVDHGKGRELCSVLRYLH